MADESKGRRKWIDAIFGAEPQRPSDALSSMLPPAPRRHSQALLESLLPRPSSKEEIMAAIEAKVGRLYSAWQVGITNDPTERKRCWSEDESKNCALWQQWLAASLRDAQDIEAHFIRMGMKGGTGGHTSSAKPVYVYIF